MASRAPPAAAAGQQQPQQPQQPPAVALSYPIVHEVSPHFSLERIEQEHIGIMRIQRLMFIAERCPQLSPQAFKLALSALKSAQPQRTFAGSSPAALSAPAQLGPNPSLYGSVAVRAQQLLLTPSALPEHALFLSAGAAAGVASDPLFTPDNNWYQQQLKALDSSARSLEGSLAQQKRDGEREGIRVALTNLAELYLNRGEVAQALTKFAEAKEFVTPQSGIQQQYEILHISLSIIRASVLTGQLTHVKTQVQRAQRIVKEMANASQQQQQQQQQSSSGAGSSSGVANGGEKEQRDLNIIKCNLAAANGLFHLKGGAYHSAAVSFVDVSSDLGNQYADVASCADVVAYASICALASFSRKELKETVLHNVEFKKMLDTHAPNTWKVMINQFYNSDYAKVFALLDTIKSDLLLDSFLSPHVNRLVRQIRERAFIQYFQAYVTVSLDAMSRAFNLDAAYLERTLAELIAEGKIAARIDSHKKVLHSKHTDARNDTFAGAMELGGRYARDVRALLLRLSLVEHDKAVRNSSAENKRKAGAAAGGAVGGAAAAGGGGASRVAAMSDEFEDRGARRGSRQDFH